MYPRGHLHRIWLVLGAMDRLKSPTIVNIAKATGLPRPTVNDSLIKLMDGQVAGVTIEKIGFEYKITEWLEFRDSVAKILDEHLVAKDEAAE